MSQCAELLHKWTLIIIDEASTTERKLFNIVNAVFKNMEWFRSSEHCSTFGDIAVAFAGDNLQEILILPSSWRVEYGHETGAMSMYVFYVGFLSSWTRNSNKGIENEKSTSSELLIVIQRAIYKACQWITAPPLFIYTPVDMIYRRSEQACGAFVYNEQKRRCQLSENDFGHHE